MPAQTGELALRRIAPRLSVVLGFLLSLSAAYLAALLFAEVTTHYPPPMGDYSSGAIRFHGPRAQLRRQMLIPLELA
jgi:hypothetical protein